MPDTPQDSRAELNSYGVPLWLVESLKAYDPVMTDENRRRDTVRTMKAKRRLAVAVEAYVAEQVAAAEVRFMQRQQIWIADQDPSDGLAKLYEQNAAAILEKLPGTTPDGVERKAVNHVKR